MADEISDEEIYANVVTVLMEATERFCERSGLDLRTEVLFALSDEDYAEVQRVKAFVRAGRPRPQ